MQVARCVTAKTVKHSIKVGISKTHQKVLRELNIGQY